MMTLCRWSRLDLYAPEERRNMCCMSESKRKDSHCAGFVLYYYGIS